MVREATDENHEIRKYPVMIVGRSRYTFVYLHI